MSKLEIKNSKRIIGERRKPSQSILEHIRSNRRMTVTSLYIIFLYIWIFNTGFFDIPDKFRSAEYLNNIWYVNKIGLLSITFLLSLPLSITFKEKTKQDVHFTLNKLLWVFLIGMISLSSVRNSFLEGLHEKDVLIKRVEDLEKQQDIKQIDSIIDLRSK